MLSVFMRGFILCFLVFVTMGVMGLNAQTSTEKPTINWVSFEELDKLHDETPKPVFIDIYTNWCGWCKRLDKTTFVDESLVKYMNENYYAVKFNAENPVDITFGGQKFPFVPNGKRGYSELAYKFMNGKMSYPTLVFLNENLEVLQPVPGYLDAINLEAILTFFKGKHYNTTPWEKFLEDFKQKKSN